GKVTAAGTGEPLPGVNVVLEGTDRGAATDTEGDFVILGVKPGKYTLVVRMIGYEAQRIEEVSVSVNRTAIVNIRLQETVLEGQEVVVTAERVAIKKDQTSSIKNVSSEQIQALPVETLSDVIEMQTGVVEGHFRGGRLTEVAYLVDGMQVKEAFKGEESTVE
ncbi:MAG: TonB-dependent receptor, partial [candidate division KSB1 bacterium]|nr:TonB-dependent receptor [candidate division KSB1 bacterium]